MADSRSIVGDYSTKPDRNEIRREGRKKEREEKRKMEREKIAKLSSSASLCQPFFETLDSQTFINLTLTCRLWYQQTEPNFCLSRLLQAAFNNYPKSFINRFKTTPNFNKLILEKTEGKERNGRKWKSVSVIEYLAWCSNIDLLKTLINLIPHEYQAKALKQIINIKENGTEHGKVLSPLIQLNNCYEKRNKITSSSGGFYGGYLLPPAMQCVRTLADFQKKLPLNLLKWYFGKEKLNPIPDFTKDFVEDSISSTIFTEYLDSWQKNPDVDIVIQRESEESTTLLRIKSGAYTRALTAHCLNEDWEAMKALYETKKAQLEAFIVALQEQLAQEKPAMKM